ncbi:NAD-dependent epimerase/dehydratase family protein [Actinopolyspora halophila]|uniref:NAD-dependent epimerase/dehydratase family protein n=1 Tax=Actinopolyspora halophila TaxID=1850 RepID=UPI000371E031|nr:NAD(P)-dependent oxidoreductase [Actinopolyspora halophila]
MPLRVFVIGATGVIGRPLLPMLAENGHHVTALVHESEAGEVSRSAEKVVRGDLLDEERLLPLLDEARPEVVLQLASGFRERERALGLRRTALLRSRGTSNLVSAAAAAGVRRVVAQSSAAAYDPDTRGILDEQASLYTRAPGDWGEAFRAVDALERELFESAELEGVALRFGALYGADTWYGPAGTVHDLVRDSALPLVEQGGGITSFTHVEDAAAAVLEALGELEPAAYNVVDNEPAESAEWLPTYARMIGGPEPVSLTLEQARQQLDWGTVHQLTEQCGATNFRFREAAGWRPRWPSWREGFAELFGLWPV